ncbi:hypothetical protein ASG74_14740 [Knoellia sp. Soil729]|nr:hypothetical protein ASG74_14740 [Knoellia sp. Soil729]
MQNSTDQQVGEKPVRVRFTLHELSDDARDDFLATLRWERLSDHLAGVVNSKSLINGRVRDALDEIEDGRLLLLQIEDGGTKGLTGEEDGTAGNFAALCKHVLVTNDDKAAKGGSYGLGKAVLWRFSAVETVLFGSKFRKPDGVLDRRVFGRTELPFHNAEKRQWAGPGWFGMPEETSAGRRAISVRGGAAADLERRLFLERDDEVGTGTTALIVGFSEPASEQHRPVTDIVFEIVQSAARWFWPRINDGTLIVEASGYVGGDLIIHESAVAALADPGFVSAAQLATTGDVALKPGDVAERSLELRVPREKTSELPGEIEGQVLLRLFRVDDDGGSDSSSVALIRGAGMVVKHHRVAGIPLQGGGYRAVLVAGTRHGADPSDAAIEEFLRSAEPPEHDQWVHHTNALRSRYRPGAKARLDEMWNKIRLAVMEMTSSKPGTSEEGPSMLARYFQMGGKTGTQRQKHRFLIEFESMRFDGVQWAVEGRARRTKGDKPWHIDLDAKLAGESAKVPLEILDGSSQNAHASVVDAARQVLRIEVARDVSDVRFKLSALPREEDRSLALESTLRVDARPHEEV